MRRRTWWAGVHPRVACRPARTSRPTIHLRGDAQSYVANELLAYYPRTELDSLLTATLTQYWTSGRTQTEIDDAIAGAGFQTQADADLRYLVRAPGAESGQIFNLVQEQFTPRIIRNLLPGSTPDGRRHSRQSKYAAAPLRLLDVGGEADGRFLRTNDLGPLDARYFVNSPGAEGGGIFNLVQTQFTPRIIRKLAVPNPPLRPAHPGQTARRCKSAATAGPTSKTGLGYLGRYILSVKNKLYRLST